MSLAKLNAAHQSALYLWILYYFETETFDRTLPGNFSKYSPDEWLPRGELMRESNRFALKVSSETVRALNLLRIDNLVAETARDEAKQLSYDSLRKHAERILD